MKCFGVMFEATTVCLFGVELTKFGNSTRVKALVKGGTNPQ